jgi:hypothetical protein
MKAIFMGLLAMAGTEVGQNISSPRLRYLSNFLLRREVA